MERRNRSLKALDELKYIDSLVDNNKQAEYIVLWYEKYLDGKNFNEVFDLPQEKLKFLSELFFRSINILKTYHQSLRLQLQNQDKIKSFFR